MRKAAELGSDIREKRQLTRQSQQSRILDYSFQGTNSCHLKGNLNSTSWVTSRQRFFDAVPIDLDL